jgi:hypothetical protein
MRSVSNPVSLPSYIVCALLYASYALLRILKSSIVIISEEKEEAKTSLFLAIGLMKSLSIDNNDMCSKSCMYLTQLWNSSRAFKKADGTDMLDLRARSRLNGSHVVDTILWWREEFDPHFKVQMQQLKHSALGKCYSYKSHGQILTCWKIHCLVRKYRTSNSSQLWTSEILLCSTLITLWAEIFHSHKIFSTIQALITSARAIHKSRHSSMTSSNMLLRFKDFQRTCI